MKSINQHEAFINELEQNGSAVNGTRAPFFGLKKTKNKNQNENPAMIKHLRVIDPTLNDTIC
jgi:hypothetical protein